MGYAADSCGESLQNTVFAKRLYEINHRLFCINQVRQQFLGDVYAKADRRAFQTREIVIEFLGRLGDRGEIKAKLFRFLG